jgi:hypothetical protein
MRVAPHLVTPAKAGVQGRTKVGARGLVDSGLRRNDGWMSR